MESVTYRIFIMILLKFRIFPFYQGQLALYGTPSPILYSQDYYRPAFIPPKVDSQFALPSVSIGFSWKPWCNALIRDVKLGNTYTQEDIGLHQPSVKDSFPMA